MKNSLISVDMIYRSTFRLIHYTNIHFSHVPTHPLYIRHFVLLCSGFIILCLSNCEEIKTSQSLCEKDVKKLYVLKFLFVYIYMYSYYLDMLYLLIYLVYL